MTHDPAQPQPYVSNVSNGRVDTIAPQVVNIFDAFLAFLSNLERKQNKAKIYLYHLLTFLLLDFVHRNKALNITGPLISTLKKKLPLQFSTVAAQ